MGNATATTNMGSVAQGVASNSSCDRRWLKGGRILHPSWHIGNATFAKDLCETLVLVPRVTSHRSPNKTHDALSSSPVHGRDSPS